MIGFAPLVPLWVLGLLGLGVLTALALALWGRLRGWVWRGLSLAVLLAALSGPVLRQEDRDPLPDIVFVVIDETSSQSIGGRKAQVDTALAGLDIPAEVREIRVQDAKDGSLVIDALATALADVRADQVAGALILSDGQIVDADRLDSFPAPVHLLRTGRAQDWDRRLVLTNAPAFGIVGEEITLQLRIQEEGAVPAGEQGRARISISIDGGEPQSYTVQTNTDLVLPLVLPHGGRNVVHFVVEQADGELTPRNNAAVVQINGVRDRLRVLLVSGEPYAGERIWRNLLKADSSVDLVHFTILRPPEKQDGVPVNELSLIAFPTRELFLEKLDDFDLVIFDRYRRRGILPPPYLANIVNYAERGGAVLIAAGPAYAGAESLYRSPLQPVLPVSPTARVIEDGYVPEVSDLGKRHPVTRGLRAETDTPWGRWFRLIEGEALRGDVVMTGADGRPLLVLDRVGQGRTATLLSDHAWLWSRGVEGGGPQLELLRRLAHWMMKEPELEEEQLLAAVNEGALTITRQSLQEEAPTVTLIDPQEQRRAVELTPQSGGVSIATVPDLADGVYRLTDEDLSTVAVVGAQDVPEFRQVLAASGALQPLLAATGGGVISLEKVAAPDIRKVRAGRVAAGEAWVGIVPREAYRVLDIRQFALLPLWAWLLLAAGCAVIAWVREGR